MAPEGSVRTPIGEKRAARNSVARGRQCTMRKLLVVSASMSLSLAAIAGPTLAQNNGVQGISTNADGAYVSSTAGVNPTANGQGGTIIYGDINTGPGYTVVEPPTTVQTGSTTPPPAAAPAPEPETVAAPAAADTAAATNVDQDADNYADELEWDLGLDPNNADTDADGVADGDELNIYGTDPLAVDTDGDGVFDGEELFGISTDPLVWDDFSAEPAEVLQPAVDGTAEFAQPAADTVALSQDATENVTATDGDAAALGPGSASASPGSVTRGSGSGNALLGPDGTYSVSEIAPPNVSVSGDTDVIEIIPAAPAAAPEATVAGCSSYLSWYDAQVAYEAAGMTDADPAMVQALDPDYDGIACEELM